MNTQYELIPFSHIIWKPIFNLPVRQSITSVPVILHQSDYIAVSGFIDSEHNTGHELIPALVIKEMTFDIFCALCRDYLPVQCIRDELHILNACKSCGLYTPKNFELLVALFDAAPHRRISREEYEKIQCLPENFLTGTISPEVIFEGITLPEEIFTKICTVFLNSKTSAASQMKFMKLYKTCIAPPDFSSELSYQQLYDLYYRYQHPELIQTEEQFKTIIKNAMLPPNVSVKPPPFFEGEKYQFVIQASSFEELINSVDRLKKIEEACGDLPWLP